MSSIRMSCASTAKSAKFTAPNEEETTTRWLFADRADSSGESFGDARIRGCRNVQHKPANDEPSSEVPIPGQRCAVYRLPPYQDDRQRRRLPDFCKPQQCRGRYPGGIDRAGSSALDGAT